MTLAPAMKDEEAVSDGKRLIVPRFPHSLGGVTLPSICVKCGKPADSWLQRKFRWHALWLYFVLLFGFALLIGPAPESVLRHATQRLAMLMLEFWFWKLLGFVLLMVYLILRSAPKRRMELEVPLCAAHALRRRIFLSAAWVIVLGALAAPFFYGTFINDPAWELMTAIRILIQIWLYTAIIRWLLGNPIRPARIDDHKGVFKGCSKSFLEQLPGVAMAGAAPQVQPARPGASPPPPKP